MRHGLVVILGTLFFSFFSAAAVENFYLQAVLRLNICQTQEGQRTCYLEIIPEKPVAIPLQAIDAQHSLGQWTVERTFASARHFAEITVHKTAVTQHLARYEFSLAVGETGDRENASRRQVTSYGSLPGLILHGPTTQLADEWLTSVNSVLKISAP